MPVTCEIDDASGIVRTTIQGHVQTREVLAALKTLLRRPDFRPGLNGIVDVRHGSVEDMHTREVMWLAELIKRHSDEIGSSRTAIVVSRDVDYGLGRMFDTYAGSTPVETSIFRNLDDAVRWLATAASH